MFLGRPGWLYLSVSYLLFEELCTNENIDSRDNDHELTRLPQRPLPPGHHYPR